MKYLKKFNESSNYELSSQHDKEIFYKKYNSLDFNKNEINEIKAIMANFNFFEHNLTKCFLFTREIKNSSEKSEIYITKYEDYWFYLSYYKNYNSNAIVYKCDQLNGLIECLKYILQ